MALSDSRGRPLWRGPKWLQRLARSAAPHGAGVGLIGEVRPVSVVNASFGAFGRMPLSRLGLYTGDLQPGVGAHGFMQIAPAAGYHACIHNLWVNATPLEVSINGSDLGGTAATAVWEDENWDNAPNNRVEVGTAATASFDGTVVTFGQSVNLPANFNASVGQGVPWLIVPEGRNVVFRDTDANEDVSFTALVEFVRIS